MQLKTQFLSPTSLLTSTHSLAVCVCSMDSAVLCQVKTGYLTTKVHFENSQSIRKHCYHHKALYRIGIHVGICKRNF